VHLDSCPSGQGCKHHDDDNDDDHQEKKKKHNGFLLGIAFALLLLTVIAGLASLY
jgi:hypothetical protein